MKKAIKKMLKVSTVLLSTFTFSLLTASAQAPQMISYQAVAVDNSGNPLANTDVTFRISLLQDNANGTLLYSESFDVTTNDYGLVNLVIGTEANGEGVMGDVHWGEYNVFMKVELDVNRTGSYTLLGTQQMMTVPYAFYAKTANSVTDDSGKVVIKYNSMMNDPQLDLLETENDFARINFGTTLLPNNKWSLAGLIDNTVSGLDRFNFYYSPLDKNVLTLKSSGLGVFQEEPAIEEILHLNCGSGSSSQSSFLTMSKDSGQVVFGLKFITRNPARNSFLYVQPGNQSFNLAYSGNFNIQNIINESPLNILTANSSGNIGIGTASPAASLDVAANSSMDFPQLYLSESENGDYARLSFKNTSFSSYWSIAGLNDATTANERLNFYNSTTGDVLSLTGDGNVGIGTTSPNAKLHVLSNSTIDFPNLLIKESEDDYARLTFGNTASSNFWTIACLNSGTDVNADVINFYHSGLGGDVLSIKSNGNILSGTTSDIRDAINIGTSGVSKLTVSSHTRYAGYFETDTADGTGVATAALVGKYTGDINENASGVIGVSCPVGNGGKGIGGSFRGGESGVYAISDGGTDNTGFKFGISAKICGSGSANKYAVYGADYGTGGYRYAGYFYGNLHYTGTLTGPSDRKFKENIVEYSDALSSLMKVKTYSFNYKNDGEAKTMRLAGGKQLGFVAQQLEEVFPELVKDEINAVQLRDEKTGMPNGETEEIKYKGVNYIGMIPVLTKAIQEQQTIIEEQNKKIEEQNKKIEALNAKLGITD